MTSSLRDATLRGDELAWQSLYDESFDQLWKYVEWRCGGNRVLAEDVIQETWVVAVRRIRDFMPQKAGFATWLCGIAAKNLQACFRRERGRRSLASLDSKLAQAQSEDKSTDEAVSLQIAVALADLPERFEAVLRAKYLDSMTVNQIAGHWGETPKAVESLLTRARDAFRQAYRSQDQPQNERQGKREMSGPAIQVKCE